MILMDEKQLRVWAYDPAKFVNVGQDFELWVGQMQHQNVVIECASDDSCPKQCFFVKCAYLIVGDAVRSADFNNTESDVLAFIRRAEETGNEYLLEFAWRAKALIENPSDFDYDSWCGGELARALFKR